MQQVTTPQHEAYMAYVMAQQETNTTPSPIEDWLAQEKAHNIEAIKEYCRTMRPLEIYLDREDELSPTHTQTIINALSLTPDKAQDALCEVECELDEAYIDARVEYEREAWEECAGELELDAGDDAMQEVFLEYVRWEGDVLRDLATKTCGAHVAIYPTKPGGERFTADDAAELLGCSAEDIASTYESEELCFCGTLDIEDAIDAIRQGKRLAGITLGPDDADQLLMHCGWHGSGNQGEIKPTKTLTTPCDIRVDNGRKYGVDAVWGFTDQFWQNGTPRLVWQDKQASGE